MCLLRRAVESGLCSQNHPFQPFQSRTAVFPGPSSVPKSQIYNYNYSQFFILVLIQVNETKLIEHTEKIGCPTSNQKHSQLNEYILTVVILLIVCCHHYLLVVQVIFSWIIVEMVLIFTEMFELSTFINIIFQ